MIQQMNEKTGTLDFADLSPAEKAHSFFIKAVKSHKQGDFEKALSLYGKSIAYNPHHADTYNNMAVALRKCGHFEAALSCYKRALSLRKDHAGTYSNMGNVLNDLDRIEDALAAHTQAVTLAPEDLLYQYNKALALRDAGQYKEALALFDQILSQNPTYKDCRWDRAITSLLSGDLKSGFADYDARWELKKSPARHFPFPRWNGESLKDKRLFIHREQGFGDAIQFIRFLPLVKERFGGIQTLECQPELIALFQGTNAIDEIIPSGTPIPTCDYWVPLMSLPHLLGIEETPLPCHIPYLSPSNTNAFNIRPAPAGGLNIAIAWGGSPTHQNDRRRSVNLENFLPLCGYPDVTLFSVQKGPRSQDLRQTGGACLIVDAGAKMQNFDQTASLLHQMDLVITVDTSVAHLAGAMGKPVWVLLPFAPDWRWMHQRSDSPWYPTMRLFRQPRPGDWTRVFEDVYRCLEEKLDKIKRPA